MPQLRLTEKMVKELKINKLNIPSFATTLYDDWYLDVTRILRKKVFIFMHINTRIALAIPSYEIGGIHNLLECFPLLVREFLNQLDYEEIAIEAYEFFAIPLTKINFTKTDNKSIASYIRDFKLMLEIDARKKNDIDQALCDSTSEYWLNHLMKDPLNSKNYITPFKLIKDLFSTSYNCLGSVSEKYM